MSNLGWLERVSKRVNEGFLSHFDLFSLLAKVHTSMEQNCIRLWSTAAERHSLLPGCLGQTKLLRMSSGTSVPTRERIGGYEAQRSPVEGQKSLCCQNLRET
ncbi:hypothetical protein F2P79_017490 [Pimephales promelas]|nr:hypothetical protein F2P79_017490 [Pimephales promelas]